MDLFEYWLSKKEESIWVKRALTARSFRHLYEKDNKIPFKGKTNEELATYGDAIIKLCYCEILLDRADNITTEKEKYESDETLVKKIACHYDLIDSYIDFDRDDSNIPQDYNYTKEKAESYKYIATAVEAMIGAIYKETKDLSKIIELLDRWKKMVDDDIIKLGNYSETSYNTLNALKDEKEEKNDKASVIIYNLLRNNNGKINVKSFNNNDYDVYLIDCNSFSSDKALYNYKIGFEIFDVVIELLKKEGGKARKGNCRGYNKLGDENCNKHTIAGAIGYNYFMKEDGESVFDTVHIVTALLDYAGICENKRGYIVLKQ